jgi:hypothetical protein
VIPVIISEATTSKPAGSARSQQGLVPRDLFSTYGSSVEQPEDNDDVTDMSTPQDDVTLGLWLSPSTTGSSEWSQIQRQRTAAAVNDAERRHLRRQTAGVCHHWGGGDHYRMFDANTVLSLPSSAAGCERVLLAETRDNLLRVSTMMIDAGGLRRMAVRLLLEGEELVLDVSAADQRPTVMRRVDNGGEELAIPGRLGGLVFELANTWLFVEAAGLGLTLRWNTKVSVKV